MSGTKLRLSSAYHPQMDGQMEALYGRPSPLIPAYHDGLSLINEVDQSLLSRDKLLKKLKHNLEASINKMKQVADLKKRDVMFEVGDLVFLKLHPYRQQLTFRYAHQKLAAQFFGPYPIVQKLELPPINSNYQTDPAFTQFSMSSLLKKFVGEHTTPPNEFPPVSEERVILLEPQHILDTRWVKQGSTFVKESLVQWKHLPIEEATWENTPLLLDQFSNVDLEDKNPSGGGSVDEPRRSAKLPKPNPKYQG
ncbi:hypothetical protein F0562_032251 [Nyssa sinensis]|uniref:Chromo domain-containing protein n=1 Tax=Nyssa sinensis TaxID=561372 RepID=A0A5J5APJ4_9ASTE|nr:hypothetical protein F0562_032251 [Nyssa sinensis]